MIKLNVLDLFSGIGGFSLGLERTGGFRTVAFCEIERFARAVLAKHWPDVPCHGDITTREFIEGEADVICGGFPCQDISLAGAGAGLAGERSGLWRELLRAIRVVRPASRSWKTWQHCLLGGWEEFSETWPRSGRMRNGIAYRRAPLVPLTSAIVSGSLLPTPRAEGMDAMGSGKHSKDSLIIQSRMRPTCRAAMTGAAIPERLNDKNLNLEKAVAQEIWPTPRTGDGMCHSLRFPPRPPRGRLEDAVANSMWRTPNASDATKWSNQTLAERQAKGQQIRLNTQVSPDGGAGGQLNPTWIEWLMGFPLGWTVLKDWATPSSRKSRKRSGEQS